jgi:hypothetical protein
LGRYFLTRSLAALAGICLGIIFRHADPGDAQLALLFIEYGLVVPTRRISPKLSEIHSGFGKRVADASTN